MDQLYTKQSKNRFTREQIESLSSLSHSGLKIDFEDKYSYLSDSHNLKHLQSKRNSVSELSLGHRALLNKITQRIMNDPNISLLALRPNSLSGKKVGQKNILEIQREILQFIEDRFLFEIGSQRDFALYGSAPHSLPNYISAIVMEEIGVNVCIVTRTFARNFYAIRTGLRNNLNRLKLSCLSETHKHEYLCEIKNQIQLSRGSYSAAIPDYEKKRIDKNNGKIFSFANTFWKNKVHLDRTIHAALMWSRLYLATKNSVPEKYVIYYLQYQPERTSLPEAGIFCNQHLAIRTLRAATPVDTTVVVREHPSTFSNYCDKTWRSRNFYSSISTIDGVQIASIEHDPFDLIDNAVAVATLTGTVAFEARARGIPVVFLGQPFFTNGRDVHHYTDFSRLSDFIGNCCLREREKNDEVFPKMLADDLDYIFPSNEPSFFDGNLNVVVDALRAIAVSDVAKRHLIKNRTLSLENN
jgi:hypothetical protein